jgi:HEAT repeat protein
MKTKLVIVVWSFLIVCVGVRMTFATDAQNETQEIERIQKQLEDKILPEPPTWTLIHMAAEKEKAEALEAFCSETPNDNEPWNLAAAIQKGGGLAQYRKRIAALLSSQDATVRGFAAVWLADLGDKTYAKDILSLLESDNLPDAGGFNKNWDRGQAAFALGVLDAKEYTKTIADFLYHEDKHLRAGAAMGLARMKAQNYEKEIASLLGDNDDEEVVCAAITALAELGAKQYSGQIGALTRRNSVGIPEKALTALVTLDAKEEVSHVANLLKDEYKGGQAAITLALLGADQYAPDIAKLLTEGNSLTKADALVALGILRATRFAPEVGKCMHNKESFVRDAAAWSIVMMEAKPYAKEAIEMVKATQKEQVNLIRGQGIPWDRLCQLNRLFAESFARVNDTQQ